MRRSRSKPKNVPKARVGIIAMIALFCWMAALAIGKHLAYLELQSSYLLRSWLVFAALFVPFFYLVYVRRGRSGTAMQLHLRGYDRWSRRAFQMVVVNAGVIIFPAFLALTSGYFPALATQILARDTFADAYVVLGADKDGRRYYNVSLRRADGAQSKFNVARRAHPATSWTPGSRVCIYGRSWALGRVVRKVEVDVEQCGVKQGNPSNSVKHAITRNED